MGRAVLPLALLVVGCARAALPDPSVALRQYLAASVHDEPRAAWAGLSDELRRRIPEREFAERWRATALERRAQAEAAREPLAAYGAAQTAELHLADGRTLTLVRESAGWRLAAARPREPGGASPEEAVRRFAQALEAHDFDGVMQLLGDPLRGIIERELADRLARLKATAAKGVKVDGDRARIRFDDRYFIDLKRENGQWRVADFN
jgi:hypothetical protein